MLTLPLLFYWWTIALIGAGLGIWNAIRIPKRRWAWLLFGYLIVGLFSLALPMKAALPATSLVGVVFLTLIWPFWFLQSLGYSIPELLPLWFQAMLFNV
jgi:uncharacterized membrane protein YraQ (UPF0718 family)